MYTVLSIKLTVFIISLLTTFDLTILINKVDFKTVWIQKKSFYNSFSNKFYNFIDLVNFLSYDSILIFFKHNLYLLNIIFYVKSLNWFRHFLLSRLCLPNNLTFIVDGAQFVNNPNNTVILFNSNSLLIDNSFSVYTDINYFNYSLNSLNILFKSSIWLERELSDFTDMTFIQTKDTRRLLIDYTEIRADFDTHGNSLKTYSNMLYDLYIPVTEFIY